MKTIVFVCHGNICRSPMAEYIAKYLDTEGRYHYFSRAVSNEEYLNDIYPPAKEILRRHQIPFSLHQARRISLDEFLEADTIFVMDNSNIKYLERLFPEQDHSKVRLLDPNEIEDPWYTGNFERVYQQITAGIKRFLGK
ncbi:MAG: low molecular weight phosphotyrosine protein phosphatase [Bacilli bacterium]|nr:low molecular weight phosphotyrosine protein phosphatase [Bacilli bacterium]